MEQINTSMVIRLARIYALDELMYYLESHPKYITRRDAERKYKTLFWRWNASKHVKPIQIPDGKHEKFPLHDLIKEYKIWRTQFEWPIDDKELKDAIKIATRIAFEEIQFHLDRNPKFITRRQAKRRYRSLLKSWESYYTVRPISTMGCKHEVFPLHELEMLYSLWVHGKIGQLSDKYSDVFQTQHPAS